MALLDRLKQTAHRFKTEIAVLGVVYRNPRTPWYARAIIFLVITHSLSPIDLIPDFIPVLGYLDDLILVPLGITLAIKLVPAGVFEDARKEIASRLEETGISGWWFGAFVIVFWLCVIARVVYLFRHNGE